MASKLPDLAATVPYGLAELPKFAVRGLVLSFMYFHVTRANDTTLRNVVVFVSFYIILVLAAMLLGINPDVVTTAFITKTVFILAEDRIRKEDDSQAAKRTAK